MAEETICSAAVEESPSRQQESLSSALDSENDETVVDATWYVLSTLSFLFLSTS